MRGSIRWDDSPGKIGTRLIKETRQESERLARTVFHLVIKYSPVLTGSYRASWRVSYNTPANDRTVHNNPATPLPAPKFEITGVPYGKIPSIHIVNNTPYAEKIENGYSAQAPQGVLRRAMLGAGIV